MTLYFADETTDESTPAEALDCRQKEKTKSCSGGDKVLMAVEDGRNANKLEEILGQSKKKVVSCKDGLELPTSQAPSGTTLLHQSERGVVEQVVVEGVVLKDATLGSLQDHRQVIQLCNLTLKRPPTELPQG